MRSLALFCAFFAVHASAATLSGTVTGPGGAAVGSAQVRLWIQSSKGFSFTDPGGQTTMTNGPGQYSFANVAPGNYIIDVQGGGFADRYFESDGGAGYVDAAIITVGTSDISGLDMVMDVSGGIDGTGTIASGLADGIEVVGEQVADPRINHNDLTQGMQHQGEYHMRGLPPGLYRVALHYTNGTRADMIVPNITVANGLIPSAGAVDLPAAPNDPNEPNNTQPTATMVSSAPFQQVPQTPYTSNNARVGPQNTGDVDWYCTTMRTGDRLVATAVGVLHLETGSTHESPWVDPLMSLWRPDGTGTYQKVQENDDSAPGTHSGAIIDTGELLDGGGPMCVVVTTYGDSAYAGTNQGSSGDYQLTMKMGNRGPAVSITGADGGLPLPPQMVTINEGDTFTAQLVYSDPENDMLSATWDLRGASMSVVTQGSFDTSMGMSTFQWTASQIAARDSPYTLTFSVSDGDIARTSVTLINVLEVNVTPTVPVPLSPADGGHVASQTPDLVCSESFDPDEETTTYEYEVYYGDGGVQQSTSVPGVDGGFYVDGGTPPTVTFTAGVIPENARVQWRVRAFDGHPANGHSAWSPFASFIVDVVNDPPLACDITKPLDGDTVTVQKPTITVAAPVDPEGDPMQVFVDIAKDNMFMQKVDMSGGLMALGTPLMWTTNTNLDWGMQYFARAHAEDNRGGVGAFSPTVSFTVRENQPPSIPPFVDPDMNTCMGGFVLNKPASVVVGQSVDPEMDTISVELAIFLASEDPDTATPVFNQTRLQMGASTVFDISGTPIPENLQHRIRVRAKDMYHPSGWGDCTFTVGMPPMTGGGGGSAGTGGGSSGTGGGSSGTGGGVTTPGGCHCGGAEGLLAVAALALLRRRRQR